MVGYSKHNDAFSSRLKCPFNLTSHDTQKELLEIAEKMVKNNIVSSVEENRFYTVLLCSFEQEQVGVRYAEGLEKKRLFLDLWIVLKGQRNFGLRSC